MPVVRSPLFAAQTRLFPTDTPIGLAPTRIGAPTTVAEARSMRVTVPSPLFATHTNDLERDALGLRAHGNRH